MNDARTGIESARKQAQELHKKIQAAMQKDQGAMRTEFAAVADKAKQLGESLKTMQGGQSADVQRHVGQASVALQEAAAKAKAAATAGGAEARVANQAVLARTRDAVKELAVAVAAGRAKVPV